MQAETESYTYIDPISLARSASPSLADDAAGPAYVSIDPPGIDRRLTRYAPEFIDDPGNTGMFKGLAEGTYLFPPNFIAAASDAKLIGYRTILAGDRFFTDQSMGENVGRFLDRLASADPFPNEDTRLRRVPGAEQFKLETASRRSRHLEGTVVMLTSTEPSNYGSFLFRVLPKVTSMKQHGLIDIPVIVYANNRSIVDLLVMAGIKEENIIRHDTNQITQVDRLIVPSLRNPDAFLDEASRAMYQEMVKKFGESKLPGRKLYISRLSHAKRGGSTRVMLNEEELIRRLTEIGVEVFEPETHSSIKQLKAFSSAEMVIGPSGSAMFNTVFCRPGTKIIDIESEPHWIFAHTGLFASNELRYGIFVGVSSPEDTRHAHRSWTVNIDALIARIETFGP